MRPLRSFSLAPVRHAAAAAALVALGAGSAAGQACPTTITFPRADAGGRHTVLLRSDGVVLAWGENGDGQLGDGGSADRLSPYPVLALEDERAAGQPVMDVSAGGDHTLVIVRTSTTCGPAMNVPCGSVWAFGDNDNGQLGNDSMVDSDVPVPVTGITTAVRVFAGGDHSLALLADGTVMAWGANGDGQLGIGTFDDSDVPVVVPGLAAVVTLAAGGNHSLALIADGSVRAFGDNDNGQLGDGTTMDRSSPVSVRNQTDTADLSGVGLAEGAISAGFDHSLALLGSGTVLAWGDNAFGQLGDGSQTESPLPVTVSIPVSGNAIVQVAAGDFHSLARRSPTGSASNRTLVSWGRNNHGQLGRGTTTEFEATPANLGSGANGRDMSRISAGGDGVDGGHSLAIKSDQGSIRSWGRNDSGQLGLGTTNDENTPKTPTVSTQVVLVQATASDPTVCPGGTSDLGTEYVIGGTGPYTYAWTEDPVTGSIDNPSSQTPTVTPPVTTTYTLTVTDANNCTGTSSVTVTVTQLTVNAGADQFLCTGGSVLLGGSPTAAGGTAPFTYSWSPTAGLDAADVANPIASQTGTFTVTVTDAEGCTGMDSVTVAADPEADVAPTADAGPDKVVCDGGSTTIGTAADGTSTYSWTPAAGLSDAAAAQPTASPAETTEYTLVVTGSNACTDVDRVVVTVNPALQVTAGASDDTICSGQSTTLSATPAGGTGPYTYSWSPTTGLSSATAQNPTATPGATTTYTVTVTDAANCTAQDSVQVTVLEAPTASAGADQVNPGCGSGVSIGGSPTASGGTGPYTYAWSPSTGLSSTTVANPTADPSSTQTYTVTVTDANGCTATDSVQVTAASAPVASAGADRDNCDGAGVTIGGSPTGSGGNGSLTFSWSPSTGLSSTTAANPTADPGTTTTYTVTVTDASDCTATDSVVVFAGSSDTDGDQAPDCVELAEGIDPLVEDNDVFGNDRLFVMQQYRDFLGREGDEGGIQFWVDRLQANQSTPADVIADFFFSPEFQTCSAPVTRLYFAYFLRIPDYPGLLFWIEQCRQGTPLADISQFFSQSQEFQDRYGSLSNAEFVDLVYNNVLGRDPDAEGAAFWTAELDSGRRNRGQVMLEFSESAEYRGLIEHEVFVTQMYVGMLRRAPEQGGFDFWVGELDQGRSRLDLINGFYGSDEYHDRFLP